MIHISRKTGLPEDLKISVLRQLARETLKKTSFNGDLTIVLTDNQTIQNLNRDYRKTDAVTDVLSFPSDEFDPQTNVRYLGDIIISVEKAHDQALKSGRPFKDEMSMLVVHGCLHLSGYDHSSTDEKEHMKSFQEAILAASGVENYAWPEDV